MTTSKVLEAKVRPITNPDELASKDVVQVYVSKDTLLQLTGNLESGRPCYIEKDDARHEAILSPSKDGFKKGVVQMSRGLQRAYGIKLSDQVRLSIQGPDHAPDAQEVVLEDITPGELPPLGGDSYIAWREHIHGQLDLGRHSFPGQKLEDLYVRGPKRTFVVRSVNGSLGAVAKFADATVVRVVSEKTPTKLTMDAEQPADTHAPEETAVSRKLELVGVQGIGAPLKKLNEFFGYYNGPLVMKGEVSSCGMVIHGGKGTGKSMLLDEVAKTGWGTVHKVNHNDKTADIKAKFTKAREQRPSIVLIDDFQRLSSRSAAVDVIGDEMDMLADGLENSYNMPRVVVLAACLDYESDIPEALCCHTRFPLSIFLPLPDVAGRRAILRSFNPPLPADSAEAILTAVAEQIHAYNCSDIVKFYHCFVRKACGRRMREEKRSSESSNVEEVMILDDFEQAKDMYKPAAMHDVNLSPPTVRWDDIGGNTEIKHTLQQAVKFMTTEKSKILALLGRPPSGYLLYGPPGCSKTMMAQAMATESGLNFFAVKGAELLNSYVGETEKAIRNIFAKARAAKPSIIFFDEIDSIAETRDAGARGGGVKSLTTLLNEMDGFEVCEGVLCLAATNRPDAIDPALLRRFNDTIYVPPPDAASRETMIARLLRGRSVEPDVDAAALARDTEGHSGKEIQRIFDVAGTQAWVRKSGVITADDLQSAIRRTPKRITTDMLNSYEAWARRYQGNGISDDGMSWEECK